MISGSLKSFLCLLLAILFLSACTNPIKLIESGRFDQAISLSAKKLKGKKKKNVKHVKALEDAFARATHFDLREIKMLEKEDLDENWVRINFIHQRIRRRQMLIEPMLPLVASDGYRATFNFVKIEDLEIESKEKAADFYYREGKRLLSEAERGDKAAARSAHDHFNNIRRYYSTYRDEARLMRRAKELGTVYVLFRMENDSRTILPKDFEREIKRISVRDLDREWRTVHLNPEKGLDYDYTVVMRLTEINVSPDLVKEREYMDDKTIEEGWEYVLDRNGNVMKDSSGNDIKIPKKIIIKARVFETYQQKAARVGGRLEFLDNREREVIYTEPIAVETIFENYAATFDGDKRALSEESKRKIGNRPVPFPSSENLILQAADRLKPILKDKIARSRIMT